MKLGLACALLVACGDGGDPANPDAPPINPGSVSVEVRVRGVPQANVEVMFQEADSTVTSVTATGLDGIATGDIGAGGFVTVVEPRQGTGRDTLSTFTNVRPDDALHLDLDPPVPQGDPVTFGLQITPDTDPLAVSHVVKSTCGDVLGFGIAEPVDVTMLGCGPTTDMLVISGDETGAPLHAKLARDVRLDVADIVLDGDDFTSFLTPAVTYQDVPDGVTFIGVFRAYETARGRLFETSVGIEVGNRTAVGAALSPELATETTDVLFTASSIFPPTTAIGQHLIFEWSPVAGDRDYTLNVTGAVLREYTARPAYDPATRAASWTESGAGQEPNLVRSELHAFRDDIPEGRAWTWRIVGGRDGTQVVFPQLPPARDGFDFNVIDGDTVAVHTLTTAKLPAGYDDAAVRAHGFADLKNQVAGTKGQLVTQDLTDFVDQPDPE